jgi:ribosome-binding protein aMBF1 (putative translation factor)
VINVKDKKLLKTFGLRVRQLRDDAQLSQEKLANMADIPLSQVGRLERGEINCTISTANALAKALKLELNELFTFTATGKKVR